MKKRYLYALLFIIPGFLLALPLSLNIFESLIAIYNTYGRLPRAYSEDELFYVLIAIFLIIWVVLVLTAYWVGSRFEGGPKLSWMPALIMGFTVLFFAYILRYAANYAVETVNVELCSEYCQSRGYHVSIPSPPDAPEQTCYCSNSDGRSVTVPLEDLR